MTKHNVGACVTVAKGGVGESGASSLLHHQVTGKLEINMVLRTVNTSLCPNTGAHAMLSVNGEPKAFGDLTAEGASIQANANPGDHVVAIVHAVPLFNDIACVRLGELCVELQQCDFVT